MPFGQSARRRKRYTGVRSLATKIAPIFGEDKARAIANAVARRAPARPRRRTLRAITQTEAIPLPNSIVELSTMHYQNARSDKVWGGAVVRRDTGRDEDEFPANIAFRYVAFWGRRKSTLTVRPFEWSSREEATKKWQSKVDEKNLEGYKAIEWSNPMYGLAETVRELGVNLGGALPPPAKPQPVQRTPRPSLKERLQKAHAEAQAAKADGNPTESVPMRGRRNIQLD